MKNYICKRVGDRYVVLDATGPKGEPPILIGTITGDSGTGYTLRVRGGERLGHAPEIAPIRVLNEAMQVLYLEYLLTLTPTTTGDPT